MYTMKEMFGVASVKSGVEKRTQLIVFNTEDNMETVANNVNAVISESKKMEGTPDYSAVVTVHTRENGVQSVKVTLKTRKNDKVGSDNLCSFAVIPYVSNFRSSLINFISEWIDNYFITKKAQANIDELNAVVSDMCGAVKISFVLSDNVVEDIANDKIVIGLSTGAAANVSSLQIFNVNETIRDIRREALRAELQAFTNACEVLKSKTGFFKALDVYTRNGVASVLKKTYRKDVKKDIKDREICRFEYKDNAGKYFGLIEKVKADKVADTDVNPILTKGGYCYFVVLSPFGKSGKNVNILSDEDTAIILDTVVA